MSSFHIIHPTNKNILPHRLRTEFVIHAELCHIALFADKVHVDELSLHEWKYRFAHLLPHFSADRYPPMTPFEHVDPALRALSRQPSCFP